MKIVDSICLNEQYSTTRLVTKEKPIIEKNPDDKFETVLFLPPVEGRKEEGGLRIQGYFKTSLPNKPLVTIITVVFNSEGYLEQTIQSVINQTYDNVEYIIIDGGSEDRTIEIINKYDMKIDYWISERDQGIYDAMNKGLSMSTGDFVYFLGSDDILSNPDIIDSVVNVIIHSQLDKRTSMFYGDVFHRSSNILKRQPKSIFSFAYLNICHQAIFYNREMLSNIGGFDIRYTISADHVVNIKLWSSGSFYMPIEICKYAGDGVSSLNQDQLFGQQRNFLILSNLGILPFFFQLFIKPIHLILKSVFPQNFYRFLINIFFSR